MKWLIITQYFYPEPGAPQIRLYHLAKNLIKKGNEVHVITALPNYPYGKIFEDYRGKFFVNEKYEKINIYRVPIYSSNSKNPFGRILSYLSFTFFSFIHILKLRYVDVVFIESQPISLGIWGILSRLLKIPYIYNIPDLQVDVANEMKFLSFNKLLKVAQWLELKFIQNSYTTSVVTNAFKEYYSEKGINPNKLSFLPNGVDIDSLYPKNKDVEYLKKLNIPKNRIWFVYAGTMAHYHGLENLIEAAKDVKNKKFGLLMIGNGPIKDRLISDVNRLNLNNIVFFRESPFDEMRDLMSIARADIILLKNIKASRYMRLSKTFPPLACGTPVLYSGIGESAEIIKKNKCGIVVSPEKPDEISKNIKWMIENEEACAIMGRNGLSFVKKELVWSSIIDKWLKEINLIPIG